MDAIKLVPKGEPYKDQLFVWVDPKSEAEKLWRERDYATEDEIEAEKTARPRMFRREASVEPPEPPKSVETSKAEPPAPKPESGKAPAPETERHVRKP